MKKVIWITGASSGIGKALALKFANENWNVAISARRENILKEISESNENIKSFPLDVTNKEKCKEVFDQIKSHYGDVNVNSIKAVEEYFKNKNSGIITIVSSIAGYRGLPNSTGYGPSKSALNNLAESLYFDFGRHNVRVCLVSPGFIKTPMTDKNDFKMPFLKTTEFAADKIYDGLINKNNFEIHFPFNKHNCKFSNFYTKLSHCCSVDCNSFILHKYPVIKSNFHFSTFNWY